MLEQRSIRLFENWVWGGRGEKNHSNTATSEEEWTEAEINRKINEATDTYLNDHLSGG